MKDAEEFKKAQLSLGEPFAIDFSEYTRKVRNNLMLLSILSIVLITNNLELTSESSFLGLQFNSYSMELIYELLFYLIAYFLIHFIWLAWDNFLMWKLRLTGSHKSYEGGFASDIADNKQDISQTTLYSWWLNKMQNKNDDKKNIDIIIEKLGSGSIDTKIEFKDNTQDKNLTISELQTINKSVQSLTSEFSKCYAILSSTRVPASLKNFNKWFDHMKTSQSLRWIIIELFMPIIIGFIALYILFAKAF